MIYHITSRGLWQSAIESGEYSPPSLQTEGFIHCSRSEQALGVANDFYRGGADLLLLCIDESKLSAELRWEAPAHPAPAGANHTIDDSAFPHIYGELNLEAVVAAEVFREGFAGFEWPPNLPQDSAPD